MPGAQARASAKAAEELTRIWSSYSVKRELLERPVDDQRRVVDQDVDAAFSFAASAATAASGLGEPVEIAADERDVALGLSGECRRRSRPVPDVRTVEHQHARAGAAPA